MKRYSHLLLVVGFFVSFRLWHLAASGWVSGWERDGFPASDARTYDLMATNLLEGRGFAVLLDGFLLRAYTVPLYPVFLAFVYFLFGHSYPAAKIAQQALGLGSCLFLYGTASRLFNRRAGLTAALLFSAHAAYSAYSVALMTEALFTFMLAAALFFLSNLSDSPSRGTVIVAAVITGLAILTRPAAVSLVPAAAALLLCAPRPVRARLLALYLVTTSLTILPWLIRNYMATGGIYFAEIGPRQFWTGSNPRFDGQGYSRAAWEELLWRDPYATELARSQRMVREALAFIAQDPELYLRFAIRRFHQLWMDVSTSGAFGMLVSRPLDAVQGVIVPLGALGLFRAIAHWRVTALLGTTTLAATLFHLLFGADPRYRLPFDVVFLIWASYVVTLLVDIRHVDWRDFSVLCRRDPSPPPPRAERAGRRRWPLAFGGLVVSVPLLLFAGGIIVVPGAPGPSCELSPDTARRTEERFRTLGLLERGSPPQPLTYRDVWTERARHAGGVGLLEGAPVVWGGQARYLVRDPLGRVTKFDFLVNLRPGTVGDDIVAVTLPEPVADLREGQCVVIAGVLQERRVESGLFGRPLIRPVAVTSLPEYGPPSPGSTRPAPSGSPAAQAPAASLARPVVILAAGDSITAAGYPGYLQALFDEARLTVRVVNGGVKGHTSGEYLAFLKRSRLLERTNPDFVLLQLGTNDVRIDADHTETPRFHRQVTEILDRMLGHRNPDGTRPAVFLATIPPVVVAVPRFFDESSKRRVTAEINPAIRRLGRERGLPLVETYELFARHPEWLPEIHPNEDGYRGLARQWFEVLLPHVRRRAA